MVSFSWVKAALGAACGLLLTADSVSGSHWDRISGSSGYRNLDKCPKRCSDLGTDRTKWSFYHNLNQFAECPHTVFQAFSIYDDVDDASRGHGIFACSSYGSDFANMPKETHLDVSTTAESIKAAFEIGWWDDGHRTVVAEIRSVVKQLRQYLRGGHGSIETPEILFVRSGRVSVGLFIGQGLQNKGFGDPVLKTLEHNLRSLNATSRTVAMQFCQPDYTSEHIFGLFATGNNTFAPVQQALQTWSNSSCLSFPNSKTFSRQVVIATPIVSTSETNISAKPATSVSASSKAIKRSPWVKLHGRAECSTIQVNDKDGCGALATRCGISGADFTKYNTKTDLCSKLQPGQHVCCSSGDLPDFRPKQKADGSCFSYYVKEGDNCSKISAANSLTNEDLADFNKQTWGWTDCEHLQYNMNMCLSKGDPPMPATLEGTVCGPAVPGTQRPTGDKKLADLNPCPLNACCDVWGQCGTTAEFCTDTSTGNPGTAAPGTNGCFSNCGTSMVRGDPPASFRRIGYYEGYNLGRECLYQDALQINPAEYTHLHFGFGTLTAAYEVGVGDIQSQYQFRNFLGINGPKKIISFGGWDFSTMPETYKIFREGTNPTNRFNLATKIANFVKANNLDGVDIDWEYPSAPDLPDFDPGKKEEGTNYLAFLVILKNLLPGKSVSIAAPASYWYLKGFPIKEISKVVDYIIYMTYDLHGQWDANNKWAVEGCPNGNCLRSQVNLTETINSMVMITKAGVPSGKVVVGITSYGRSFNMATAGCYGSNCPFTGDRLNSDATKGRCTGTAGYISNAEINEIVRDGSRVTNHFVDQKSDSNILVYDNLQWVGYMSDTIRAGRSALYKNLNMGGTTNWATDLERFNDVPPPMKSWSQYKLTIAGGGEPQKEYPKSGNWFKIGCDSRAAREIRDLSSSERWKMMDCDSEWNDVVKIYKEKDQGGKTSLSFSQSVSNSFGGAASAHCESLRATSNCGTTVSCTTFNKGKGAAAAEIWNSLVLIHELYKSYHDALFKAFAAAVNPSLADFENKMQPIPPKKDDSEWLFLLLNLVTVGVSGVAAPFFNRFLAKLPYFIKHANGLADSKDLTLVAIGTATSIAKDMYNTKEEDWDQDSQDTFSNYLGQAMVGWGKITDTALQKLFDGSNESIDNLYEIIRDGHLIDGDGGVTTHEVPEASESQLEAEIAHSFFAYATPTAWRFAKHYVFVIDSGYACGTKDPLGQYLSDDTMHATWACYQDKLYYMAEPKGPAYTCVSEGCIDNKFSAPPGIGSLDGKIFGGVTREQLIIGSVRTWIKNDRENKGDFATVTSGDSFDDLMDKHDVTTPGYIRLPVCSPELAYKVWDSTDGEDPDRWYPCNIPKGIDMCRGSSFIDQTSGASPTVKDCRQIIKNIQYNSDTSWLTGIATQREILSYGSCAFGVESDSGADGNVTFDVGGQDVIDIITDAIKKFTDGKDNSKIGAKGFMKCNGNVHETTIEWGIY